MAGGLFAREIAPVTMKVKGEERTLVVDETPAALHARQPGARLDEIFRGLTQGDL
mgnify:CR=1 FL=1